MTSNQLFLLCVLLCGISLHMALGQMDVFHSVSGGDGQGSQNQQNVAPDDDNEEDDEDEDDAMSRVGEVGSIEEFISLLQHADGQPVTLDEVNDAPVVEEGKIHIGQAGRMAVPDNCSPRNVTVRIEMDDTDSDTAYFPRCTKIERCGGCCSSPNLECVPSYTERIILKVLKGRVPFPGAPHLQYTGFASKIEDRHVTCRVDCKLNAESCGPKKDFSRRKCNCKCKNRLQCSPPTSWDPEDCSCKCPSVSECCSTPNCGMVWSHTTCECVLSNDGRVLSNDGRVAISANDANNAAPSTEQTTRSSSSTTTTTTATTEDPCASISCPPRLVKVRAGNVCNCRFSGGRRRRNNRRG